MILVRRQDRLPHGDSMVVMKCAAWLLLVAPWVWAADESADRAAIDKLVAVLKEAQVPANGRIGDLLSSDIDLVEFNRQIRALSAGMITQGVWTEVSPPAIVVRSVQFLTPDIALVDGANVQIGSTMTRRVPFVLIAKRENTVWKVAVLRTLNNVPARMQLVRAEGPL
ncbi:MAG: hypothetical protein JWO19_5450 [Bryobacterales bacterium]|nr:hypothetical protein [Bryobacterales bacterium]